MSEDFKTARTLIRWVFSVIIIIILCYTSYKIKVLDTNSNTSSIEIFHGPDSKDPPDSDFYSATPNEQIKI